MSLRLYAQSCSACGRKWVLVTVGEPDDECPYCSEPGPHAVRDPGWPPDPPDDPPSS